ncbi:MAG: hypothetical protein ACI8PZ_003486 [Myxococcota bacterium]|jgi:hypothetical protein
MVRTLMILTALVAVAGLAGCTHSCNLMYAPSSLVIEIDGAVDAGEWRIEVDGIGCTVTLPMADEDVPVCDDFAYLDFDATAIYGLSLESHAPDRITITALLDGNEVASETRTPAWRESEPNGEGCGVRRQTTESIAL